MKLLFLKGADANLCCPLYPAGKSQEDHATLSEMKEELCSEEDATRLKQMIVDRTANSSILAWIRNCLFRG